jgi:hypothetical protein
MVPKFLSKLAGGIVFGRIWDLVVPVSARIPRTQIEVLHGISQSL